MTQDEIIEMAQECRLIGMRPHLDGIYIESLLAFAKLVAEKTLAEHAMQEVQRLGQEIEPDDIASILACRDMLDAQPVPQRTEQEPVCPDCKAKVLYECVACSSNNYPPKEKNESTQSIPRTNVLKGLHKR